MSRKQWKEFGNPTLWEFLSYSGAAKESLDIIKEVCCIRQMHRASKMRYVSNDNVASSKRIRMICGHLMQSVLDRKDSYERLNAKGYD